MNNDISDLWPVIYCVRVNLVSFDINLAFVMSSELVRGIRIIKR